MRYIEKSNPHLPTGIASGIRGQRDAWCSVLGSRSVIFCGGIASCSALAASLLAGGPEAQLPISSHPQRRRVRLSFPHVKTGKRASPYLPQAAAPGLLTFLLLEIKSYQLLSTNPHSSWHPADDIWGPTNSSQVGYQQLPFPCKLLSLARTARSVPPHRFCRAATVLWALDQLLKEVCASQTWVAEAVSPCDGDDTEPWCYFTSHQSSKRVSNCFSLYLKSWVESGLLSWLNVLLIFNSNFITPRYCLVPLLFSSKQHHVSCSQLLLT